VCSSHISKYPRQPKPKPKPMAVGWTTRARVMIELADRADAVAFGISAERLKDHARALRNGAPRTPRWSRLLADRGPGS
jgi:hypothetical protein